MPRDAKEVAKDRNKVRALVGAISGLSMDLASSQSKEESLKQILESFKQHGALNQKKALDYIYPLDPIDIMPVIITIMELLYKTVEQRQPRSAKVEEFIVLALKMMKDVDRKQNLGLFEKTDVLKELNKEKIKADMKPLMEGIERITILETEALLWYELVLWLEGSYLHVHNAALKYFKGKLEYEKDDPEIVSDYDWEDTALKKITGITKHFIQEFFHRFAEKLQQKINKDLAHQPASITQPAPSIMLSTLEIKEHEPLLKSVVMVIPERRDNLLNLLIKGEKLSEELLFTLIASGLKECRLTGREDVIVVSHVSQIKAKLTSDYIGNSWSPGFMGIQVPTRIFSDRTHAIQVREAIESMERSKTALEVMEELHRLWVVAISDKSTNLKPVLLSLVKDLYNLLRTKLAAISEPAPSSLSPV